MNNNEITEIIESFRESHLLLNFIDNFKPYLDFKDESLCLSLLVSYKKFGLDNHLDQLFSSMSPLMSEKVEEYIKQNFTLYYAKEINKDLSAKVEEDLSYITSNVHQDNLHEYIEKGIINSGNINSLMKDVKFDSGAFLHIMEYYQDKFVIDKDLLWENIWFDYEKFTSRRNKEDMREKFYILLRFNEFPSQGKMDFLMKSFLESSSLNNRDIVIYFEKFLNKEPEYIINLIKNEKIKIKKPLEKFKSIFSLIKKEKSLKIINDEYDFLKTYTEILPLMIDIMAMNISRNAISYYEQAVSVKIKQLILNHEKPMDLIIENVNALDKIRIYLIPLDELKDFIIKNISFDKIKRKDAIVGENSIVTSMMQSDKSWNVFFTLFKETKKAEKDYFFKGAIQLVSRGNWITITDILKRNSPKFYEKEVKSKDLSLYERNKEVHMLLEKEKLIEEIGSRMSENISDKANKKRL